MNFGTLKSGFRWFGNFQIVDLGISIVGIVLQECLVFWIIGLLELWGLCRFGCLDFWLLE